MMAFNFIILIYIRNVNCLQAVKQEISVRLMYREGKTKDSQILVRYNSWSSTKKVTKLNF